jgi:isoquinoline 1-oxidoreductase beta subunit
MSELRKISRREFMKRTGQAGGGLVFALSFASACQPEEQAVGPAAKAAASVAPNVYVNMRNDGIVEIYCHRSEMGQGIYLATAGYRGRTRSRLGQDQGHPGHWS